MYRLEFLLLTLVKKEMNREGDRLKRGERN
jgi:hypothetical protein